MNEESAFKILKELGYEPGTISYCRYIPSPNGTRQVGVGTSGFTIRDAGRNLMFLSRRWEQIDEKEFKNFCNPSTKLETFDEEK